MSLMEVLISLFILSIGLLGVAALIPIGKLAMIETNKSDRTGACGRAALHDLKVRNLLSTTTWNPSSPYPFNALVMPPAPNGHTYQCTNTTGGTSGTTQPAPWPVNGSTASDGVLTWQDIGAVYVADPLGVSNGLNGIYLGGGTVGPQRINLSPITSAAVADSVFRWQDDLVFSRPEEMKSGAPPAGTRPVVPPGITVTSEGKFSWFLTVASPVAQPGPYSVAVVVCNGRVFTHTGTQPDGEALITGVTCDNSPSYGGVGVSFTGTLPANHPLKRDDWLLLFTTETNGQCAWYRVVGVGYDGTSTRVSLVGPDWYGGGGGGAANIVIVDGVTGVYTETVQLN